MVVGFVDDGDGDGDGGGDGSLCTKVVAVFVYGVLETTNECYRQLTICARSTGEKNKPNISL